MWAVLPVWVFGGTMLGFLLVVKFIELLVSLGLSFPGANENVMQLVLQALSYVGALLVVIGLPYLIFGKKINLLPDMHYFSKYQVKHLDSWSLVLKIDNKWCIFGNNYW